MKKSGTDNTGYQVTYQPRWLIIINDLGFNKSSVSTWCNSTRLPRMESELLAAHQRTDIEVTLEGIQSDLDIMNDDNLRK